MTTVFVTHDQDEAMEISDQIAVINHGRLEQIGKPPRAVRAGSPRGHRGRIRYYVDADQLRELFAELVLPPPVRRAWADWLGRHRPAPASGRRRQEAAPIRFPR